MTPLSEDNLVPYMATYADPNSASADFDVLKAAEGHDLDIRGAVVKNRDADGIGALLVYAVDS